MYAFKIERPTSVKQAVALLANEDAKLLAGGHSLIPVMKQRLASPKVLVDLSKIDGLSGIEVTPRTVTIKAMATKQAADNHPAARYIWSRNRRIVSPFDLPNALLCPNNKHVCSVPDRHSETPC